MVNGTDITPQQARKVQQAAEDIFEVMKAQKITRAEAVPLLGAITASLLKTYDNREDSERQACQFCMMLLADVFDNDSFLARAQEAMKDSPHAEYFMEQMAQMRAAKARWKN